MNKRLAALFGVLLLAGIGYAASEPIYEVYNTIRPSWFQAGLYVGPRTDNPQAVASTTNKVTRFLGGTEVVDFASSTITCLDSTGITISGAQLGDPCFAGASVSWAANTDFTCFVDAANHAKIRYCPAGTAADPPSATYFYRIISSQ